MPPIVVKDTEESRPIANTHDLLSLIQVKSTVARSLATDASLKTAATPPAQAEKIKYFKIYRWDPEQNQKPYLVRCCDDDIQCACCLNSLTNTLTQHTIFLYYI